MRINLKEMYSLELSVKLEQYYPDIPENFGLSIRLMLGPEGSDSAESFDVLVCTPDWIKGQLCQEYGVWGRHMLIVSEYDHALILEEIARRNRFVSGKGLG